MKDTDPEVRRALIHLSSFRRQVDEDWLISALNADVRVACDIANQLDIFDLADPVRVLNALAVHPDPGVRSALASTRSAGRQMLRQLAEDGDVEVAISARDTLNNW